MSDNNLIIPDFDRDRDKALKIALAKNNELPGVLTVFLMGRLDNYNTAFFQDKMERIFQSEFKKILFRCSSLEYISSSGFGVLANYFPKFKEQNGTFVFADVPSKVLEVFHLLGFDRLFGMAADSYDINRFFDDSNIKSGEVFPKIFKCPICEAKLKTTKPGKFRCSKCKVIITVDDFGTVSL